jgi:uncharacterized protein YjiS (DUF1127 family)
MRTRLQMTMPEAFVGSEARRGEWSRMTDAIASQWTKLHCAWMRRSARRRLGQSVAHLDDRLLADIGLTVEDLSITERLARRQAAGLTKFLVP